MTLGPIDRDEDMDRTYIPLPGGWEVQTKGKGSSFRLCNTATGDRWIVTDERLHKMLEQMACDVHAAAKADSTASLQAAYWQGWCEAAAWANRDDLIADRDSSAFELARARRLATLKT